MIALLAATALATAPPLEAELNGDVKTFFVATFPYEHFLMPEDPTGLGVLDGRVKTRFAVGPLSLVAHHAVTATTPGAVQSLVGTGTGGDAPEAMPLSWDALDGDDLSLSGRTDRLFLKLTVPHFDATVGRQPISFGAGAIFTPLDLVNPFFPTTIDQEYKPGVDAVRLDGYVGMTRITAVAAYAGDWDLQGTVLATWAQTTVGVTDLGAFYGAVRGDHVWGLTTISAIGPVGVHADAALTLPEDGPVFFRGVVGAMWRPFMTTTLSGEFYVQTVGTFEASDYLAVMLDDRWTRGELWLAGHTYLGLSWGQEIVPTLNASLAVIANLADPSALVAPGLAWSVAENADVGLGMYAGIGARPDEVDVLDFFGDDGLPLSEEEAATRLGVRSEMGTWPVAAFVQVKTYF